MESNETEVVRNYCQSTGLMKQYCRQKNLVNFNGHHHERVFIAIVTNIIPKVRKGNVFVRSHYATSLLVILNSVLQEYLCLAENSSSRISAFNSK